MKTAERDALDFALAHIERHGDTTASDKAKQHRVILAEQEADPQFTLGIGGAVVAQPDATGHAGEQAELEHE